MSKIHNGVAVSTLGQYGRSFFGKDHEALGIIEGLALGRGGVFRVLEVGPGYGLETLNVISNLEKKGFFLNENNKIFIKFLEINKSNLPALKTLSAILQGAFNGQITIEEEMVGDITKGIIDHEFDAISFLNVHHYLSETAQREAFSNMARMLKGDGLLVGTVHTQKSSQKIALELCFNGEARNPIKDSSTFVAKNN